MKDYTDKGTVTQKTEVNIIDDDTYEVLDYFEGVTGKVLRPIKEWVILIHNLFQLGYTVKDLCFVIAVKDYEWDGNNINPTVLFSQKFPVYFEECKLSNFSPKKILSIKQILTQRFVDLDDFSTNREIYGRQCAAIRKLERGEVPARYVGLIKSAKKCHLCFIDYAKEYQEKLKKPAPSRVGEWHKAFLKEHTLENYKKYCEDIELEAAEVDLPPAKCFDHDTYERYCVFVSKLGVEF